MQSARCEDLVSGALASIRVSKSLQLQVPPRVATPPSIRGNSGATSIKKRQTSAIDGSLWAEYARANSDDDDQELQGYECRTKVVRSATAAQDQRWRIREFHLGLFSDGSDFGGGPYTGGKSDNERNTEEAKNSSFACRKFGFTGLSLT
jgi:hypothetical protein